MKRILISLLLCPLTIMAMEEKQQSQDTTPKNIYAGLIVTILNDTRHKGTRHAFPVARQTFIYELQNNAFEYVDTIEEWNESHGQVKHIDAQAISHVKLQSVYFKENNTQVSITSLYENPDYPTIPVSFTETIKLGQVIAVKVLGKNTYAHTNKAPALFQPDFLPYTSFNHEIKESTIRDERLAKKPGNAVLTTIAFLRLEERRKESSITYIPSPCTDFQRIL